MNASRNHEWVVSYNEFEAVLVCTNELAAWDRGASIRAYQTYGWNDASTGGDEQYFSHEDSGVMIRHDGDVVAIEFAEDRLKAALFDLFKVLHALGWRHVEVYHPPSTMGLLLNDIGKAIPAAMELDVQAAKSLSGASQVPEGRALVEQGLALMRHQGFKDFDDIALGHLQELGSLANFDEVVSPPGGTVSTHSVSDGAYEGHDVSWDTLPSAEPDPSNFGPSHSTPEMTPRMLFGYEDEPPVVSLDAFRDPVVTDLQGDQVPAVAEPVTKQKSSSDSSEPGIVVTVKDELLNSPPANLVGIDAWPTMHDQQDKPSQRPSTQPAGFSSDRLLGSGTVQLGKVTLAFDTPDAPLSPQAIAALAAIVGTRIVDHVWPGLAGQAYRWDLLGEIAPGHPAMAEVIAEALGVKVEGRALLGALFLHVGGHTKNPQLRDVLLACARGVTDADNLSVDPIFLPLKGAFQETFRSAWRDLLQDFAGVIAYPPGQGFVDVRAADSEERTPGARFFTLSELKTEPASRLIVVHLDSTDGLSIVGLVGLMRTLAHRIAASTRADMVKVALDEATAVEQERKRQQLLVDAAEKIGPVVRMLREAGVAL